MTEGIKRTPEQIAKMREGYAKYREKQALAKLNGVAAKRSDVPKKGTFAASAGPVIEVFRCECGERLEIKHRTRGETFSNFSGVGMRFRFYCDQCRDQYNVSVVKMRGVARPV